MPLISVILPVYNGEEYLSACLESLVRQTLQDIEIIAVNNASTDNSAKILREYKNKDSRLKIIEQNPNVGPSGARNIAMKHAEGEYLAFCDCDDTVPANAYQLLWEASGNGTAVVICGAYTEYAGKSARPILHMCGCENYISYMSGGAVWNRLFRRSFLEEYCICFEKYSHGEDSLFIAQVFQYAVNLSAVDQPVYNYHTDKEGTLAHSYSLDALCEYLEVENRIAAMKLLTDPEWTKYCLGKLQHLRNYWWHIADLSEKERGFQELKEYVSKINWACSDRPFEIFFGIPFREFTEMDFGEYMVHIPMSDAKEMVLRQFRSGEIGFRYIWRYFKAWLKFKRENMSWRRSKLCQKSV